MCGYLKKLYSPYQQKLAKESAGTAQPTTSGATPFSQMKSDEDTYHMKVGVTTQKRVRFETDNSLEEAVEKLTTAVDNLTYQQERQDRDKPFLPRRPPKPYKPYITKGRDNRYRGKSKGQDDSRHDRQRSFSRDRAHQGCFRSRERSDSGRRFQRYDRSPSTRKPRTSSRPVNVRTPLSFLFSTDASSSPTRSSSRGFRVTQLIFH